MEASGAGGLGEALPGLADAVTSRAEVHAAGNGLACRLWLLDCWRAIELREPSNRAVRSMESGTSSTGQHMKGSADAPAVRLDEGCRILSVVIPENKSGCSSAWIALLKWGLPAIAILWRPERCPPVTVRHPSR